MESSTKVGQGLQGIFLVALVINLLMQGAGSLEYVRYGYDQFTANDSSFTNAVYICASQCFKVLPSHLADRHVRYTLGVRRSNQGILCIPEFGVLE